MMTSRHEVLIGAMVRLCRDKYPDLEWSDVEPVMRRIWTAAGYAPRWDRVRDLACRLWCRAACGSRGQPVVTAPLSLAVH